MRSSLRTAAPTAPHPRTAAAPKRRYSFEWWTVALGGLGTILAILTSLGILSLLAGAVGPLLIVNTALLCVIASDLMPVASNLTVTETKGD